MQTPFLLSTSDRKQPSHSGLLLTLDYGGGGRFGCFSSRLTKRLLLNAKMLTQPSLAFWCWLLLMLLYFTSKCRNQQPRNQAPGLDCPPSITALNFRACGRDIVGRGVGTTSVSHSEIRMVAVAFIKLLYAGLYPPPVLSHSTARMKQKLAGRGWGGGGEAHTRSLGEPLISGSTYNPSPTSRLLSAERNRGHQWTRGQSSLPPPPPP